MCKILQNWSLWASLFWEENGGIFNDILYSEIIYLFQLDSNGFLTILVLKAHILGTENKYILINILNNLPQIIIQYIAICLGTALTMGTLYLFFLPAKNLLEIFTANRWK